MSVKNVPGTSSSRGTKSSCWVFTLNHPEESDSPLLLKDKASYCVWQLEKGENDTPHYQGYAQFSSRRELTSVRKLLPRAHWEPRRGSHEQALAYCTKEETRQDGPWEYGVAVTQGQRTDLEAVCAMMLTHPVKDVALAHPVEWVRYHKGLLSLRSVAAVSRTARTRVEVHYGAPGCGKSHHAMVAYPDAYWKNKGEWWDNYDNHKVVVIDEYYGWLPFDLLCRLCDKYPLQVPVKGGHVNFSAELIIITSNKHPREWYDIRKVTWPAFCRRVDEVWFYQHKYQDGLPPVPPTKEDINYPDSYYIPLSVD